jgi:protein SCO1/2
VFNIAFAERKAGDYVFIDQDRNQVTPVSWNNKVTVVDFFFTSCPSICPKMTNSLRKIQQQFGDPVSIVSFTVDPAHDSAEKLRKYAQRMGIETAGWKLLTGDKRSIYQLARKEFKLVAADGDGGPADFIHSNKLVLIDRQMRIRGYYDGTSMSEVADLERDIHMLLDE